MAQYRIEAAEEARLGSCACCGGTSRRVWGYVHYGDAALAAYFVTWTEGQVAKHGANWDFVVGTWGEGTTAENRVAVALAMRLLDSGPEFMVIDAEGREMAFPEVAGKAMARHEVIGTQLAEAVFGMVDAVWVEDKRLEELSG
jgi:hypothetical protein